MGLGDYLVIALVVGPYIVFGLIWLYDHTEIGRRIEIKGMSEELIQLFIDVNQEYLLYRINTWLEIHNKQIIDGKIVTNKSNITK